MGGDVSACTGHLLGTEVGKVGRERRATAKICVGCPCYMTGEFVGLITFVSSKSCLHYFVLCYVTHVHAHAHT